MLVNVTTPAAGAEWSYAIPAGARLLAVTFRFVTSATVANRFPVLILDDGASVPNIMMQIASPGSYAAGADRYASFAPGLSLTTGGNIAMNASMPAMLFPRGGRVRTSTFLLDPGDQYSAITALIDS